MKRLAYAISLILVLNGCATWSQSNVVRPNEVVPVSASATSTETDPAKVLLSETDIADRKYVVLGDVEVTVNKTTLFHPDPTREMVQQELRAEAAKLGADAVILVRYGTLGISAFSWGSLDGRGRAVRFAN